ncbi:hypothetical protein [Ruegeria sp. HKCCD7318]|uniref:hypothetical protein n=1 Tax=Ruegeria sp. HKCCD7318 TaxID=2683014 RepID=UPI001492A786|nr:hypothetical protein [Ruegeria sp. HKCCD7318]NOE36225.1 hypothetical protein [Ruegeria sp. HKCCD7318]
MNTNLVGQTFVLYIALAISAVADEGLVQSEQRQNDILASMEDRIAKLEKELKVFESAVVGFYSNGCPQGWKYYTEASGIFLRGIDIDDQNPRDDDAPRAPGDYQPDQVGSHKHPITGVKTSKHADYGGMPFTALWSPHPIGSHTKDQMGTTEPNGLGETRPKNVAVYFCTRMRNN